MNYEKKTLTKSDVKELANSTCYNNIKFSPPLGKPQTELPRDQIDDNNIITMQDENNNKDLSDLD